MPENEKTATDQLLEEIAGGTPVSEQTKDDTHEAKKEEVKKDETPANDETSEEVVNEEPEETSAEEEETEEAEESEESEENAAFVTDEIIEKFPFLKTHKGKKVEDVLNSYQSMNREYTRLKQENKQLREKPAAEETNSKKDEPSNEEDFAEIFGDNFDLLELEPDEQKKALFEAFKRFSAKQQPPAPQQQQQQQGQEQNQEQDVIIQRLTSELPEGIDVNKLIADWQTANAKELKYPDGRPRPGVTEYYSDEVDGLTRFEHSVINFYKSKTNGKKNLDNTYKKTVNALKKTADVKPVKQNVRPKNETLSEEDKILVEIMNS